MVDGIRGQDLDIRVGRANNIDSIAQITVTASDTSYIYYLDIMNGGIFSLYIIAGNGTNAGDGGKCGYIEKTDSVLKWGLAGKGGTGGNGGNGGDVMVYADKIYREYIDQIRITNEGGQKGQGGVSFLQITLSIAPKAGYYYNTDPALIMSGRGRLYYTNSEIAYSPPKWNVAKMPKTNTPYKHGAPGKNGTIIYTYY
ncbi:MAG: hypothetical protein SGJ10_01470 [Bacteroidota bacterium]|nr:hypothetical protein [Bacteroidota bacterium]